VKPIPPSQDFKQMLEPPPELRRLILGFGSAAVVGLIALSTVGYVNIAKATNWAMRANAGFWLYFFGLAAVCLSLWLTLFSLASSPRSAQLSDILPVKGRWARSAVITLLWMLGLLALAAIVLMPVA
jgi:hypothetical protein